MMPLFEARINGYFTFGYQWRCDHELLDGQLYRCKQPLLYGVLWGLFGNSGKPTSIVG